MSSEIIVLFGFAGLIMGAVTSCVIASILLGPVARWGSRTYRSARCGWRHFAAVTLHLRVTHTCVICGFTEKPRPSHTYVNWFTRDLSRNYAVCNSCWMDRLEAIHPSLHPLVSLGRVRGAIWLLGQLERLTEKGDAS